MPLGRGENVELASSAGRKSLIFGAEQVRKSNIRRLRALNRGIFMWKGFSDNTP